MIVCVPAQVAVPPIASTPFCRLRPVVPEIVTVPVGCTAMVPLVVRFPPVHVRLPPTSIEPVPPTVPPETTTSADAVSTTVSPSVTAPPGIDSVCLPLVAPIRTGPIVRVSFTMTVYVPGCLIHTVSVPVGTVPRLQFAATFQFPPVTFVHAFTSGGGSTLNASLVASVRPGALAVST